MFLASFVALESRASRVCYGAGEEVYDGNVSIGLLQLVQGCLRKFYCMM